ncbi:MAG: hypothetical protein I8H66_07480 [Sphingobacteriia bacterium]|nr:hypothetical protein [Sphingobacteriia bacterium]
MKKRIAVAAISCLVVIVLMRVQGAGLITALTPRGILDLEFANSPARLTTVLAAWDQATVTCNIWIDFLFIPAYVLFLSLSVAAVSVNRGNGFLRNAGAWLERAAYVAGVLDIAENLLMLQSIAGNYTPDSLWLTYYCAGLKFGIVLCIIVYLLISLPLIFKKNKPNGV